jgi:septal ring factor EnvC (AmiA/AmiB activator)
MKAQVSFLAILLGITACSPVNQANDHLASMDSTTKILTQSITEDQAYLKNLSLQMDRMQKSTEKLELELEADREYIKLVADCMKSLAESLSALQKLGDTTVHTVLEALLKPQTPNPKTSDAEDLLPPPAKPSPTQSPPGVV